jgi:hypothetical protein
MKVPTSLGKGEAIIALREAGANPLLANSHGISPRAFAGGIGNYNVIQFFGESPLTRMMSHRTDVFYRSLIVASAIAASMKLISQKRTTT